MKPIYQHLRDQLLQDFWQRTDIQIGAKLPTEYEMVARYHVSRPTISKAIAALAAEGWVTKRQGSGIYVAATVAPPQPGSTSQEGGRIGYIANSSSPSVADGVLKGIETVIRKRGYGVEVAGCGWDYAEEYRQVAAMKARGVRGIVLVPTTNRPQTAEYLAQEFRDFPIVVVDLYQPNMKRPHFLFDNYQAGRDMTEYLLARGRRDIAFLKFSDAIPHRSLDDRVLGYRRALADAGVPFVPERVLASAGPLPLPDSSCEALERFLALVPRPSVLIAPYDRYAHATIHYLRRRGVAVPAEVLVTGFDSMHVEPWWERFPTTRPDFVRMAERAAELLLERIGSRNCEPTEVVLPCPLTHTEQFQPAQLASAGSETVTKQEATV